MHSEKAAQVSTENQFQKCKNSIFECAHNLIQCKIRIIAKTYILPQWNSDDAKAKLYNIFWHKSLC